MSKKLKFEMNGVEFLLPLESYREQEWNGNVEKYIYMSAKNCASVIKQFVKKKFPHIKVWAGSDVYSGGSSVRVHVCNQDGTEVDYDEFKQIKQSISIPFPYPYTLYLLSSHRYLPYH